jgi:hypothetical protein
MVKQGRAKSATGEGAERKRAIFLSKTATTRRVETREPEGVSITRSDKEMREGKREEREKTRKRRVEEGRKRSRWRKGVDAKEEREVCKL